MPDRTSAIFLMNYFLSGSYLVYVVRYPRSISEPY
jgi:hypothetical protein